MLQLTANRKRKDRHYTIKSQTIYLLISVISQIFMLTQTVEVAFSPELYHKLFSAGNCHLPGKAAQHYWFQGPTFRESAKYFKPPTFLHKSSKRGEIISVLRGARSCPEICVPGQY